MGIYMKPPCDDGVVFEYENPENSGWIPVL